MRTMDRFYHRIANLPDTLFPARLLLHVVPRFADPAITAILRASVNYRTLPCVSREEITITSAVAERLQANGIAVARCACEAVS